MQQDNSTPFKRGIFSNLLRISNYRIKKGFRSNSFIVESEISSRENQEFDVLEDTWTQTNFRSSTTIQLEDTPRVEIVKEKSTQTSKTVVTLAELDSARLSPDSLSPKLEPEDDTEHFMSLEKIEYVPFERKNNVIQYLNQSQPEFQSGNALVEAFLRKRKCKEATAPRPSLTNVTHSDRRKPQDGPSESSFDTKIREHRQPRFRVKEVREKTVETIETKPIGFIGNVAKLDIKLQNLGERKEVVRKSQSFMSPTIASESKDQRIEIQSINKLISPTRRGRSVSPSQNEGKGDTDPKEKPVPYIDSASAKSSNGKIAEESKMKLNLNESLDEMVCINSGLETSNTTYSVEFALTSSINKLKDKDWNLALRGLAEVVELCKTVDIEVVYPNMTVVNQRLVELIRSPRSHVCRTACQAVGHMFEYIKDTRRPEFDELVDTLMCKTADSNKFIRQDANLALDCMVTHIPTFHAIRAVCTKAPNHKNPLVRTAAARLLVCAVVISGPQVILNPNSNEYTRKRIILNMVKFLDDRFVEIRKFGERIYKLLCKDRVFDVYLKRYLEPEVLLKIRQCMRHSNGQTYE